MNHIPTTATAVEKLRLQAKARRKQSGVSLANALDATATAAGYSSWKHVTVCLATTQADQLRLRPLPQVLATYLAAELAHHPLTPETAAAMRGGLVIAMDIKDALRANLEGTAFAKCDDAWPVASRDVWSVLALEPEGNPGDAPADVLDDDELLELARDDLMNYRYFRYFGISSVDSIDAALDVVHANFFFPPQFMWLAGDFTCAPGQTEMSPVASGPAKASDTREPDVIARLSIFQMRPGLYEYDVSADRQSLYAGEGLRSIREAIEDAANVTGPIKALEVAYSGITAGTYTLHRLRTDAEVIAKRMVETVASLQD